MSVNVWASYFCAVTVVEDQSKVEVAKDNRYPTSWVSYLVSILRIWVKLTLLQQHHRVFSIVSKLITCLWLLFMYIDRFPARLTCPVSSHLMSCHSAEVVVIAMLHDGLLSSDVEYLIIQVLAPYVQDVHNLASCADGCVSYFFPHYSSCWWHSFTFVDHCSHTTMHLWCYFNPVNHTQFTKSTRFMKKEKNRWRSLTSNTVFIMWNLMKANISFVIPVIQVHVKS